MATLIAPKDFSPVEDAENLKKACQGWGTDERALISILGHRNLFQRRLIRAAFEEIYHEDLVAQLRSELSGHFERAVCHWILDPADRDALLVYSELRKPFPDHRVIVEIACIRSPEDLLAVKRAYRFRYKCSLEEDVASHTSGSIRKILVALVSAYRYDGEEVDGEMAESEARIIHDDIHGHDPNHEETVRILSTRSKAQLNATFNQHKDIYKTSITKGLSGGSANKHLPILRTAIRCIKNPKRYLAKVLDVLTYEQVLRSAMSNAVVPDLEALSMVIVSSAEKDLKDIKGVFLKRNSVTLEEAVANNTSGDYKSFLLALLGSEEQGI